MAMAMGSERRVDQREGSEAMAERVKVEYYDQPPVVVEVGGRRSWEAETSDPFCNVWHETTEGSNHAVRWIKSRMDGCMVREADEIE